MLKIATWNVNSLRVRLPHLLEWLAVHKPQVIALQETKIIDTDFPILEIAKAGYNVIFSGQKTYNGMAILSQQSGTEIIKDISELQDPQRRILAMTLGDVRIINLYVPNGQTVDSEKYRYKLDWLEKVTIFIGRELLTYPKLIILGDFNIAPDPEDVHDPAQWEGQVLFSPPERLAFKNLLSIGLSDCFRLISPSEKAYSWWDYRMNAFKRNIGLRIDHILASQVLAGHCRACYIDKTPRGWERPSDHTPVIAEFLT